MVKKSSPYLLYSYIITLDCYTNLIGRHMGKSYMCYALCGGGIHEMGCCILHLAFRC